MQNKLIDLQLNHLSTKMERLGNSIDLICDRIEKLEEDYEERVLRKRIIKFLFYIYPVIMLALVLVSTNDHQKISDSVNKSKEILSVMSEI